MSDTTQPAAAPPTIEAQIAALRADHDALAAKHAELAERHAHVCEELAAARKAKATGYDVKTGTWGA